MVTSVILQKNELNSGYLDLFELFCDAHSPVTIDLL